MPYVRFAALTLVMPAMGAATLALWFNDHTSASWALILRFLCVAALVILGLIILGGMRSGEELSFGVAVWSARLSVAVFTLSLFNNEHLFWAWPFCCLLGLKFGGRLFGSAGNAFLRPVWREREREFLEKCPHSIIVWPDRVFFIFTRKPSVPENHLATYVVWYVSKKYRTEALRAIYRDEEGTWVEVEWPKNLDRGTSMQFAPYNEAVPSAEDIASTSKL